MKKKKAKLAKKVAIKVAVKKKKKKVKRSPLLPPKPPGVAPQSPKLTPQKLSVFLHCYAETGQVRRACQLANIDHTTVYQHKMADPNFARMYEEARAIASDALEGEGFRRAYEGVPEPVFSFGQVCGYVQKYSDGLLQFLLRGLKKEVYGDTYKIAGSVTITESNREDAISELVEKLSQLGIKPPTD